MKWNCFKKRKILDYSIMGEYSNLIWPRIATLENLLNGGFPTFKGSFCQCIYMCYKKRQFTQIMTSSVGSTYLIWQRKEQKKQNRKAELIYFEPRWEPHSNQKWMGYTLACVLPRGEQSWCSEAIEHHEVFYTTWQGASHTAKLRVKEASKPHSHVYWYSSGPLFCHLIAHQKLYTSPVNQDSLTTWILLDPQTKPFPISSSSSSLKLGHLKFQMIDFPYAPS